MTPESQGSLRVVAHVAQWIERLPPEQKVVGPIPTVGAHETVSNICNLVWRISRKPQLIPTRSQGPRSRERGGQALTSTCSSSSDRH